MYATSDGWRLDQSNRCHMSDVGCQLSCDKFASLWEFLGVFPLSATGWRDRVRHLQPHRDTVVPSCGSFAVFALDDLLANGKYCHWHPPRTHNRITLRLRSKKSCWLLSFLLSSYACPSLPRSSSAWSLPSTSSSLRTGRPRRFLLVMSPFLRSSP